MEHACTHEHTEKDQPKGESVAETQALPEHNGAKEGKHRERDAFLEDFELRRRKGTLPTDMAQPGKAVYCWLRHYKVIVQYLFAGT